ncbi:uncharacterized, partial [Tachysurus ichikawai]
MIGFEENKGKTPELFFTYFKEDRSVGRSHTLRRHSLSTPARGIKNNRIFTAALDLLIRAPARHQEFSSALIHYYITLMQGSETVCHSEYETKE